MPSLIICSIEHLKRIITSINLEKDIPIGHHINLYDFNEEELITFYKIIGNNVKKIRKEKKVTQIQLALAIGHNSVGHITKAELYKYSKHFSLEQLYKISKVLDIQISQLLPY